MAVASQCQDCGKTCNGKQCRSCYIESHRVPEATCLKCGKVFRRHRQYNYNKNKPKFCSRECRYKALADGECTTGRAKYCLPKLTRQLITWFDDWAAEPKRSCRRTTKCKNCNKKMWATNRNGKRRLFCCLECRHSYRTIVACVDCGTKVLSNNDSGKLCCRCQRTRSKKNHPSKIRKRCNKFGVAFNPQVKPGEVFRRDGYKCQECGRKTTTKVSGTHNRRATVDHIVPLSKGGSHEWHNVQCLCMRCNVRKSNKYVGQRRMF